MKSPRYTAGVVSIYRKYVDMYLAHGRSGYRVDPADRRALLELFDRGGQSEGYYKEHNGRDMVVLKEKPAFREPDQELFDHLDRTYVDAVKKEPIRGTALVSEGKPVRLTVEYTPSLEPAETMEDGMAVLEPVSVACTGDLAETAKNAPMDGDRIRKQLMKTGDSPFFFEELEVSVEGKVFLPVQALNRLRREALEELCRAVTERFRRKSGEEHKIRRQKAQNGPPTEKTERKKGPDSRHVWTGRKRLRNLPHPFPIWTSSGKPWPWCGKNGRPGQKRPLGSTWQARNLIRASGRSWRTAAIRRGAPVI